MALLAQVRRLASRCVMPLALRAARAYVAGERLSDAMRVADRLAERGLAFSLGYWDSPNDTPRAVADAYLNCISAIAGRVHDYVSIKVPAIDYSHELMAELVEHAASRKVRLHFDALGPETADLSLLLLDEFIDRSAELSFTLPGRWTRSVRDAEWICKQRAVVRVVKGQWPDPNEPNRDPRQGFLEVVDALAGRARHVAIATHDVPLACEATRRLRAGGTSCELELLYGLPMRASLAQADHLALAVRVYVPFGRSYLPYALSRARSNPRIMWWLLRDLLVGSDANLNPDSEPSPVAVK